MRQSETYRWLVTEHSRRELLAGLATVTAATLFRPTPACAQQSGIIDTHHHIYPPNYTKQNLQRIVSDVGVAPASLYANWSPAYALERMDKAGVATAINSMSSPGVWFNDGEAGRGRARECNEFGAQMMRDYPRRFGMFAAIPLPDIDGSLREISYGLDVLRLDGIGLLTSYAGKLLGDLAFVPVMEELNRRKAVVFVHPTMSCCGNVSPGISAPTLEFPMDTARTITNLVMSGSFAQYSDIRFIFSHGGGVLLTVTNRISSAIGRMPAEERARKVPKGLDQMLQAQHYDLAGIGLNPAAMAGLRKMLPASQLLYGSDEPLNSTIQMASSILGLGFADAELKAVQRENALQLFPRLRA